MEENWVLIHRTDMMHKAEIIKAILVDCEINCVIVNKKDSSYLFGDIEIYVHANDAVQAKTIIQNNRM